MCLVAPFEVSRGAGGSTVRSWPLQAPVCVGAADATWGGVFTGLVEATPLALEWFHKSCMGC